MVEQPTKKSKAPMTLDLFALVPKKHEQQQTKKPVASAKKSGGETAPGKKTFCVGNF